MQIRLSHRLRDPHSRLDIAAVDNEDQANSDSERRLREGIELAERLIKPTEFMRGDGNELHLDRQINDMVRL